VSCLLMACFLPIFLNFICLFLGLMLKSELDKWKIDCSGLILVSDCNVRQLCWLTDMCTPALFGSQTCARQKMVIWRALCCTPIYVCWVKLQSQWLMSNNWSAATMDSIFVECNALHSHFFGQIGVPRSALQSNVSIVLGTPWNWSALPLYAIFFGVPCYYSQIIGVHVVKDWRALRPTHKF
jgi:hypothetical protein